MQDMEQAIRERAYHLWAADGYRDGNADAYWLAAQREILASSLESVGRVKKTAKKPAEKAKTKRRAA
jgi:hypothetical protein